MCVIILVVIFSVGEQWLWLRFWSTNICDRRSNSDPTCKVRIFISYRVDALSKKSKVLIFENLKVKDFMVFYVNFLFNKKNNAY